VQLTSLLVHAQAAQAAAAAHGVRAGIDLQDLSLRLEHARGTAVWRPKFLARVGTQLAYTDQPAPGAGFAGWNPNPVLRWAQAADKDAFKRHAIAVGLRTPAACLDPARIGGPFLVKASSSSFGEGMRGPFLHVDLSDGEQQLRDGEYYENYIPGAIAKAWCWSGSCVALHLHSPSFVTGDGSSSVRDLVARLPDSRGGPHDWPLIERLAGLCNVASLVDVLPIGKDVLVEYRYGSRYDPAGATNPNLVRELEGTGLLAQFARAASLLQRTVPPQRVHLFTLDAIVDREGIAWFLEMNCNPLVHPDGYAAMVASAVGAGAGSFEPSDRQREVVAE
jgi:hypothetical protein